MKLLALMLVCTGITTASLPAFSQELTLKVRGKVVGKIPLQELRDQAKETQVTDAIENAKVTYMAIPAVPLMKKIFGKEWDAAEEVLFTCTDGYQPSIPRTVFDSAPSFLATSRVGNSQFILKNVSENNKIVGLAPIYLIWDTSKVPVLGANWPYQVISVDLIKFQDKFPKMAPVWGGNDSAKRGFIAFRENCMSCHTINGQGGKSAPELNYPVNITEYYKEAWLKKWIDKPTNLRFSTTMPPLNPDLKNRNQVINDLVSYLKIMAKNKSKPQ